MKISRDEARRIAALAHLELDESQLDRMAADMTEILGYVEQLQGAEATGAPATKTHALELHDDVPHGGIDREAVAANAPSFRDGFFVVPRVVGGEE